MIIPFLIRALVEENSVAVSGLGTFFVKNIPSHIKEEIIFPPQNSIAFEHSREAEGFDFVKKLSQWKQIRIDEAQAEISDWVNRLEKGLENNKTLFFDDFGSFSKDSSEKIIFLGVLHSKLNIENEGLEPVFLPSIKKNSIKPVKDKRHILVVRRKKRDMFWFLITILLTAVLLGVLFYKDDVHNYFKSFIGKETIHDSVVLDLNTTENDTSSIHSICTEKAVEIETTEENCIIDGILILPEKTNDFYQAFKEGNFYVIAGSFANEQDALRHIEQKKLIRYNAKIVVHPHNTRYRVCIGVFDNEKDALVFAAQIDKNYWVLK
jgi:nucleoid DNA-binding protein